MAIDTQRLSLPVLVLIIGLTACGPAATGLPASPTVPVPSSPENTLPPHPSPSPSSEDVTAIAARLCEDAFGLPASAGLPEAPVLTLLNRQYEGQVWESWGTQYYEAQAPSDVRTLVCIRESRTGTGSYTDGQPAFRLDWQGSLVRWPDGAVLRTTDSALLGDDPPARKDEPGPGYGAQPRLLMLAWLASAMEDPTLLVHGSSVSALAFSPDGAILASAGFAEQSSVNLWEVATARLLFTLRGHTNWVSSLAFSPDGETLASASDDFNVILWDPSTGLEIRTLSGHTGGVQALAFSPDGSTLASASVDRTVTLWSLETARPVRSLVHDGAVTGVAFSPDGRFLFSGGGDARVWNAATGQLERTISGAEGGGGPLAISPDGATLATGGWQGGIKMWDVATGEELRTLQASLTSVTSLAFSPDGRTLASGSELGVSLWDVVTGDLVRTIEGLVAKCVAFSPDGKTLASANMDGTIRLLDVGGAP